jgi:hypothetical protein
MATREGTVNIAKEEDGEDQLENETMGNREEVKQTQIMYHGPQKTNQTNKQRVRVRVREREGREREREERGERRERGPRDRKIVGRWG